jgi:NDP-sugar pyrophosphorylase family protein
MLIEDGGRISGVYASRRLTLTNIPDLLAINREYLSDDHYERHISPQSIGHGTQIIAPVYIETGTIIGVNCQIGPYAYIEHDCNIGDGVVIENAVILAGTSIVDNAVISRNVVALNYLPTT